jgi:hypothetical protein
VCNGLFIVDDRTIWRCKRKACSHKAHKCCRNYAAPCLLDAAHQQSTLNVHDTAATNDNNNSNETLHRTHDDADMDTDESDDDDNGGAKRERCLLFTHVHVVFVFADSSMLSFFTLTFLFYSVYKIILINHLIIFNFYSNVNV